MTTTCRTCQGRRLVYQFRIIDGALRDWYEPCPECNAGAKVTTVPALAPDKGDGLPANYQSEYVRNN